MQKVNIKALIISIFVAAIGFLVIEFLVEGIFFKTFKVTEEAYYRHLNISPSGIVFQTINIAIFVLNISLMMFVYALIRPRFKSDAIAAMVTSTIFLAFLILYIANLVNLGIYPLTIILASIIFIIIELPFTILIGAVTYSSRTERSKISNK